MKRKIYTATMTTMYDKFEIGARYLNDNLHIALKLMQNCCARERFICVRYFIFEFSQIGLLPKIWQKNRTKKVQNKNNQYKCTVIQRTIKTLARNAIYTIKRVNIYYLSGDFGASCFPKIWHDAIKLHKQKGKKMEYIAELFKQHLFRLDCFVESIFVLSAKRNKNNHAHACIQAKRSEKKETIARISANEH